MPNDLSFHQRVGTSRCFAATGFCYLTLLNVQETCVRDYTPLKFLSWTPRPNGLIDGLEAVVSQHIWGAGRFQPKIGENFLPSPQGFLMFLIIFVFFWMWGDVLKVCVPAVFGEGWRCWRLDHMASGRHQSLCGKPWNVYISKKV